MPSIDASSIYEEIMLSKKYASLYKPLVMRTCEEESRKYNNDKERVKAVKSTLHAMYGAYLSSNGFKKAEKYLDSLSKDTEQILHLHASTKERMRCISDFYKFIFETTGAVKSVLDIGCGFNPFTLPYFPKNGKNVKKYYALDIDERIAELNNRYFKLVGLPALAGCTDIIAETPDESVDVAFLFKILPLIERQAKGRSAKLLREIKAQHIVVSYPTKSLSGKGKGMHTFYAAAFEELLGEDLVVSAKKEIGDELVYVVVNKALTQPLFLPEICHSAIMGM